MTLMCQYRTKESVRRGESLPFPSTTPLREAGIQLQRIIETMALLQRNLVPCAFDLELKTFLGGKRAFGGEIPSYS